MSNKVTIIVILVLILGCLFLLKELVSEDNGGSDKVSDPILIKIKKMARLVTVEFHMATTVRIVNPRYGPTKEVLVYGVCGRVSAGVDLEKLTEKDIKVDGMSIIFRLPKAEVFTVDPMLEQEEEDLIKYKTEDGREVEVRSACSQVHSWITPIGTNKSDELPRRAMEEGLKVIRSKAEESGIKEIAQEKAEEQLDLLTRWLGYEAEFIPVGAESFDSGGE